ncbi:MAG: chromosome segregation protein SMC [Aquificae bacterium]|nr:chromosome segregation protein SMC [Aquificota bacterium]
MEKAYIDRINVYAFKSYGEKRLTIPLGDGFTAIVGPNGSGKSNIGDAIIFALGLATAKSMRAMKLSDLIFSSKGKTAEYTEVEVVFKNLGAFPLNDEEVSIYRKVEHNGRSIYKINGRVVKQYEIEELLSYAGIPKQAYNIVTQGDIFRFIKMTPSERRDILSDIAGITEYEEKKQKALKGLEETQEKLNAAKLVLKEVKHNLQRLEEEKENAEKASQIEEKIAYTKQKINAVKLYTLEKAKEESLNRLNQIENKIKSLEQEKNINADRQKELFILIKQLEDSLNQIQESLLPIKEKEGAITAQISSLNEKKKELEDSINQLQETINHYQKEKDEKIKQIISLENQIEQLTKDLPQIQKQLEEAEEALEEKNKKLHQIEIGGQKAKIDLGEIEKEEKQLQHTLSKLEKEKLQLEFQLKKLQETYSQYQKTIEEQTQELEKLKETQKNIGSYTNTYEKKLNTIKSEITRLKVRKETLENRLKTIRAKKEEIFKRLAQVLASLSQIREDRSISILKHIPGVYGQVADLIGLKDPALSTAVETAGGGRLKHIVVEDDKVAQECIQELKKNKAGRATFIPLNKIKTQNLPMLPRYRGIKGYILDFVEYDSKVEKAIRFVFGDTLLVEDFDTARAVGIGTFRMVTPKGELFEKSGTISGGSQKQAGTLLGRGTLENEKEKLEAEDDRLKKEEEAIEQELKNIQRNLVEKDKEIYKLQTEEHSISQRRKQLNESILSISNKINMLENELVNIKKKQFEEENKIDEINKQLTKIQSQLNLVKEEKQKILNKMESEGLHQLRKEWEDATNLVYKLREKKISLENQIENLKDKVENNLKVRIFQIESEKLKIEDQIKHKKQEVQQITQKIQQLSKEVSNLWKGLKDKEKERDSLINQIEDIRDQLKSLRKKEDYYTKEITHLLEEKGKLEQKIEDINLSIEELTLEYTGEAQEGDLDVLERELKKLEEIRKNIGAVNQRALEDYKETLKRYEDLNQKVNTLLDEKKSIEELIQQLEDKKFKAFMEVYQEINKNLGKIFRRLSPGGKAYLELEAPENPLEAGVFLKARPRGKDVKRLEIMSGGEKTLTALAFLFAVQQYRPAPFYYFDEVDAHLDDANARKIAELMKELSKEAQFIVVTLRDTMASFADRLIGVTATEGISNIYTLDISKLHSGELIPT